MYHVEFIDIAKTDKAFAYCDNAGHLVNNMKNTANFYIRNLMTGLKKKPSDRTPNEEEVIRIVAESIPAINASLQSKYDRKVRKINRDTSLSRKEKDAKLAAVKCLQFEMPTAEKWFANYNLLDAVFRYNKNSDYIAFHSHVIQNAIKDTEESWLSYFALRKAYAENPDDFDGKPRIPKYHTKGGSSTAVFSNLACKIKNGVLLFPAIDKSRLKLKVQSLPHASVDKLIEVRVMPRFGGYRIEIVTDDGVRIEDVLPDEQNVIDPKGNPAGVMMIDPGLNNFATMVDNKGGTPIVIKGGEIKARNQFFNKQMAFLRSEQMKGHDPKTYHPPTTKRMNAASRKRDDFLRDTFYKYAHFIFRTMQERNLSYLIVGHNDGQKQEINLGHKTNQEFVNIPFAKFITILKTVAMQYKIRVIEQEESYTSKACFGAKDPMPVYGENTADCEEVQFSGRRTKRGMYRTTAK